LIQSGFSQIDTIIYSRANNKPADKKNATKYIEIKGNTEDGFKILRYTKNENQWRLFPKKETAKFINDSTIKIITKINGNKNKTIRIFSNLENIFYFQDFYENGRIKQKGHTKTVLPLYLEGQISKYYKSGNIRSIEDYKDNQMIGNKNWLENGERYLDNIFNSVDIYPEYPGGINAFLKYIANNLKYPKSEKYKGIQGQVFISFVIDEQGNIASPYVVRGVNKNLDQAALEVIKSSSIKWSPGILDGNNVKVGYNIPIKFTIE